MSNAAECADQSPEGAQSHTDLPTPRRKPHVYLRFLSALLALEAAVMIIAFVILLSQILTQPAASTSMAIALAVLVMLGAVWVTAVFIASLRLRPWVRGAALIWQIIQLSIAIGAFQGETAQPGVGWLILLPTGLGIYLLLSAPVTAALRRPEVERYP